MASLRATGLSLTLGAEPILAGVDLTVDPGQRIGVVGPNGVGKSTLLRALAGLVRLDRGRVELAPATATVGYLPQEPELTAETVGEFLARRTGVAEASARLGAASVELAARTEGAADRYTSALERWLALGGADLDARVGAALAAVGLEERHTELDCRHLSGGEAAKAGLAAVLLARFDIMLLDEPTNDLDLAGLHVLERVVTESAAGIVLVSHDRAFLDEVVTEVVELDEFTHTATRYGGGWSTYQRERANARRRAREAYEVYEAKRGTLLARAQREREWASQGLSRAKKRPDDNDKNIRAFKINQTEQLAGRAARTERAIDRLTVVEEPREPWQLHLAMALAERSGELVAELVDAVVARGGFRLGPVTLTVTYGERVLLVGHNGSGKSTLLGALLGETPLHQGQHRLGPSVVVGRLEQARAQLAPAATVLAGFLAATGATVSETRTLLAKFGIGADHVNRPVGSLSPGERTRVVLALLMACGSNCLVLDEPTNHLDLPAIEQLEHALDSFPGTVILVTHDRALLDNVRATRRIELVAGRVVADDPLG